MASQHSDGRFVSASLLSRTTTLVKWRFATSERSLASFSASISVAKTFPEGPTISAAAKANLPSPAPISATTVPGFQSIRAARRFISSTESALARRNEAIASAAQSRLLATSRFVFIAHLLRVESLAYCVDPREVPLSAGRPLHLWKGPGQAGAKWEERANLLRWEMRPWRTY